MFQIDLILLKNGIEIFIKKSNKYLYTKYAGCFF